MFRPARKSRRANVRIESAKFHPFLARGRVPDPDGLSNAWLVHLPTFLPSCNEAGIRRPGDARYRALVPFKRKEELLPGHDLPKANRRFGAPNANILPSGESESAHFLVRFRIEQTVRTAAIFRRPEGSVFGPTRRHKFQCRRHAIPQKLSSRLGETRRPGLLGRDRRQAFLLAGCKSECRTTKLLSTSLAHPLVLRQFRVKSLSPPRDKAAAITSVACCAGSAGLANSGTLITNCLLCAAHLQHSHLSVIFDSLIFDRNNVHRIEGERQAVAVSGQISLLSPCFRVPK